MVLPSSGLPPHARTGPGRRLRSAGGGAMGGVPEGVEGQARGVLAGLAGRDVDLFVVRLRRWWDDLAEGLAGPYGDRGDLDGLLERVAVLLAERYAGRSEELKLLDLERSVRPDWFQAPAMVGYVCYADRFAGTLEGVSGRLDYLVELGVRYLHLMPLLAPRAGDSD